MLYDNYQENKMCRAVKDGGIGYVIRTSIITHCSYRMYTHWQEEVTHGKFTDKSYSQISKEGRIDQ